MPAPDTVPLPRVGWRRRQVKTMMDAGHRQCVFLAVASQGKIVFAHSESYYFHMAGFDNRGVHRHARGMVHTTSMPSSGRDLRALDAFEPHLFNRVQRGAVVN